MKIHIDFETRSRVDIWEVGAWAYSVHPSTEILCIAVGVDDRPEIKVATHQELFHNICDVRWETFFHVCAQDGTLFCAFNSFFEYCIWHNILVKKYGWPRIPIKQWRCSMAKSLAYALPQSLEKVAAALQTQHQKNKAGHAIMLKLSKPNKDGTWNEDPEDFQKLYEYCIDDVAAEREVDHTLPDLNPTEQVYWFLDQLINQRGISIDLPAVKKALEFTHLYTKNLNDIVFSVSNMELDRVSRRQAVLDWCASQGVNVPGYTKSDVKTVLEQDLPPQVRTVLDTKLELGKTSVAKYQALANSVGQDGRIRDLLIYHGATTGRWTGKLFQLHNLPTAKIKDTEGCIKLLREMPLEDFEVFYPDVMATLSSCLRGMVIASPGCELFVGDYNAIEARVLFWLAGEDYGLRQYQNNTDLYVDMAKAIYYVTDVTRSQRDLGKRAVLGCGFGMGHAKFAATCAKQGQPIDESLAQKAVDVYRSTYRSVVSMWYAQEDAAIATLTDKKKHPCGRVVWEYDSLGSLLCRLPSGRCLSYPKAFLEYKDTPWGERKLAVHFYSVDSKTKRWGVDDTYGGKITENITQAVARDILAASMLRVEQHGFPVAFSVHDEVVCNVPQSKSSDLERWKKLLCELPEWAVGCPVKAEVFQTQRYRK